MTRGQRNNNPLNIRHGSNWRGLAFHQTDKDFCVFVSMAYGLRAAFRILRTYAGRPQTFSIRTIVLRWAPPSENNSTAYINHLAEMTQIDADKQLSYYYKKEMMAIVKAMSWIESRYTPSVQELSDAYEQAL